MFNVRATTSYKEARKKFIENGEMEIPGEVLKCLPDSMLANMGIYEIYKTMPKVVLWYGKDNLYYVTVDWWGENKTVEPIVSIQLILYLTHIYQVSKINNRRYVLKYSIVRYVITGKIPWVKLDCE